MTIVEPEAATAPSTTADDRRDAIIRTAEYVATHPGDITPAQDTALRKIAGIAQNTEGLRVAGNWLNAALNNRPGDASLTTDPLPYGVTPYDRLFDADTRTTAPELGAAAGRTSAGMLTALERATFPRIVIEERELPQGTFALHRKATDTVLDRIAWDPAQTTRDKVQAYIGIYLAGPDEYVEYTPDVARALLGFESIRRSDPDPKGIEAWDTVEQAVIASDDPKAASLRIADLLAAENAEVTA
jgi:hypothetical protein